MSYWLAVCENFCHNRHKEEKVNDFSSTKNVVLVKGEGEIIPLSIITMSCEHFVTNHKNRLNFGFLAQKKTFKNSLQMRIFSNPTTIIVHHFFFVLISWLFSFGNKERGVKNTQSCSSHVWNPWKYNLGHHQKVEQKPYIQYTRLQTKWRSKVGKSSFSGPLLKCQQRINDSYFTINYHVGFLNLHFSRCNLTSVSLHKRYLHRPVFKMHLWV